MVCPIDYFVVVLKTMASVKQVIQHVESLRGGAKILPLRRLFNAILTGGNDSLEHILANYTMVLPKGSKYDQVQVASRKSHFFSQHAQYWLSMRPGGVIKKICDEQTSTNAQIALQICLV